jgi:YgiT-type zinc finger domain-containing protein
MDNTRPNNDPCDFCGGQLRPKTLPYHEEQWQGQTYRFANVPAYVCDECGEIYFDAAVSQAMEKVLTNNEQPKRIEQVPVWELSLGAKTPA